MATALSLPFRAQPGIRFAEFHVPAGHRLIGGMYGGKFGYRVIRKNTNNTPPQAA